VKASLLFMQKFTEAEQSRYEAEREAATAEVAGWYGEQFARLDAIEGQPNFKAADFLPREGRPTAEGRREAARRAKEANAELKERRAAARRERHELEERIRREARALLKERFSYPVFLYEAERVGITATGEQDLNELYRDESQTGGNVPQGVERTCLELYREFRADPEKFLLREGTQ
jgi:type I restriction enzyme M protein